MATATIDDLMRQIEKAKAISNGLEQKNAAELVRLEWLEKQFIEIDELLTAAGEKASQAKKSMP